MKTRLSAQPLLWNHANKTHFHKKGCALGLVLKVKVFGSRKWLICCPGLGHLYLLFNAPPWGIFSFSKTKWQMVMCKRQTQDLNVLLMHGQFLNIPNFGCLITSVVLFCRFGGYACFRGFVSVFRVSVQAMSAAPNDGFLLNALKTLFRLSRVLLDL